MPLVLTPPYLASKDSRFKRRQTREEQEKLLNGLDWNNLPFSRGGKLGELRTAIMRGGEKIPGRTSAESLEMVDATIAWMVDWEMKARRERSRRMYVRLGAYAFMMTVTAALIWAGLHMDQVVGFLTEILPAA